MDNNQLHKDNTSVRRKEISQGIEHFVFEKHIFSNVFEKDIRRVYIYKKAERIAKALHLVAPAFRDSKSLRDRLDRISIALIDASVLPPSQSREALARELLALSSVLNLARAGGHLSPMNSDIISNEANNLLQEIAAYEAPKISLDELPSLATLSKIAPKVEQPTARTSAREVATESIGQSKGHVSDNGQKNGRRDAIMTILRTKGPSYIKDLSTLIRDVSEKTIQRELQVLVSEGQVRKSGERRWTTYTLAVPTTETQTVSI